MAGNPKHVLITGGSSGIGAAIADLYAARGANVSLIARSRGPLEAQKHRFQTAHPNGRFHVEAADVSDASSLSAAIARCQRELGVCDVLVTCAGIVDPAPFEMLSAERFSAQIDINLMGTVNAVRAVYPAMVARASGQIVLVASGAALVGIYGYTAYCASKFALAGFAEALRQEAGPSDVQVSICFPPDTLTPQFEAELKTRPLEASAVIGKAAAWPVERVARAVVQGANRGRFAIYPGAQVRLLAWVGPLVAPLMRRLFDRRIANARRSLR